MKVGDGALCGGVEDGEGSSLDESKKEIAPSRLSCWSSGLR